MHPNGITLTIDERIPQAFGMSCHSEVRSECSRGGWSIWISLFRVDQVVVDEES